MRRSWANCAVEAQWQRHLPYAPGAFQSINVPTTESQAIQRGLSLDTRKQADIHVKISRQLNSRSRLAVSRSLERIGFYPVQTWAGNLVCTAQFLRLREARQVFDRFDSFFSRFRVCSEMTLEPTAMVWRTVHQEGGKRVFSAVPPLVVRVNN
jgi:hypothetical protein